MIRSTILQAAFASGIGLLGSAIALSTPDSPQNAPLAEVPSAANEIVVIGKRPPRCRPLASDPQDAVDLSSPPQARSVAIQRDPATGDFELVQDTFPMLGPDTWQRAGAGLDEFAYLGHFMTHHPLQQARSPTDDLPRAVALRALEICRDPQGACAEAVAGAWLAVTWSAA